LAEKIEDKDFMSKYMIRSEVNYCEEHTSLVPHRAAITTVIVVKLYTTILHYESINLN